MAEWTHKEEMELARLVNEGKSVSEIAKIMGRTYHSIKGKKRELLKGDYSHVVTANGRRAKRATWNIDDINLLWYLYNYGVPIATIRQMMASRRPSAIKQRLKKMRKNKASRPATWTPEEEATLKELIHAGASMDILFDTFTDKTMLEIKYKKMALEILHDDVEPSRQACMVVPSFEGFFKPGKEYEINIEYVIDDDDAKTTVEPKKFIFEYRTKGKTPLNVFRRKGKKYHLSLTDYEAWNRVNPEQLKAGGIMPPNDRSWEEGK